MKYDNVKDIFVTCDWGEAQKKIKVGFSTMDIRTERSFEGAEYTKYILLKVNK